VEWAVFLDIPAFSGGRDFRRKKVRTLLCCSYLKDTIGRLSKGNKCVISGFLPVLCPLKFFQKFLFADTFDLKY